LYTLNLPSRDKRLTSRHGTNRSTFALLLAAHGERKDGAINIGVARLAAVLRSRAIAHEVGIGFIKGAPSIAETARALRADEIVVYPLFLSDGYFTRMRLPEMLNAASLADRRRTIHMLPPLGLDPALVLVLIDRLMETAQARGLAAARTGVILLAHGSSKDPASRIAAARIAAEVGRRTSFRAVRTALLEEPPSLREAASDLSGPIIIFGLFAGEGMHGGGDAPQLVEDLGRSDTVFAGTIAQLDGIADVVATAVARAIEGEKRGPS
jgi:sirohydrochlorin cobaltochelatase